MEKLSGTGRHDFIEIARRILAAPGIVIPVDNRDARIGIAREKNRTVIATPWLVCRNLIKRDAFHRQPTQNCARLCFMRVVADVDANLLGFDESLCHRAQSGQNAIE